MGFLETLSIIGLVIGIISGIIAVIGYMYSDKPSGKVKFLLVAVPLAVLLLGSGLFQLIHISSSTTVSSTTSTPAASTSPVSNIQPDYFQVFSKPQGPADNIALILWAALEVLMMLITGPFDKKRYVFGCAPMPIILLVCLVFGLPFVISYVTYELLEPAFTVQLYLILCTNLVAYTLCLPMALLFRGWRISLENR